MIGRFAVDFVAVRAERRVGVARGRDQPPERRHDASRAHAPGADRRRVPGARGVFVSGDGRAKHYVATDDLESEAYKTLTPDDALDIAEAEHIGWDDERQTGVALHMVSAIAVAGRIGLTAIGDSPDEADALFQRVKSVFDAETGTQPATI